MEKKNWSNEIKRATTSSSTKMQVTKLRAEPKPLLTQQI